MDLILIDQKIKIMELATSKNDTLSGNYEDRYKKMIDLILEYKSPKEKD